MKKHLFRNLVILTCIISFTNCETEIIEKRIDDIDNNSYSNAINVVKEFIYSCNDGSTRSNNLTFKLSNSQKVYLDNHITRGEGETKIDSLILYTIEVENNFLKGFAMATGHTEIGRVYAYVESGSLSDTIYNKGMAEMINVIPLVCKEDLYFYLNDDAESPVATRSIQDVQYGPHIKTKWSQNFPYNLQCPQLPCGSSLAGCGPIAVSQAIAYYKKCDRSFDFNTMTMQEKIDGTSPNFLINTVSGFIAYVGDILSAQYGCDGTGTNFQNCYNVMCNRLGYKITYDDAARGNGMNNSLNEESLKRGDITFMRGSGPDGGHMWIVDGKKMRIMYPRKKVVSSYIHCNYGWGGSGDGWYTGYTDAQSPTENGKRLGEFYANKKYMYLRNYE